MTDQRIPSPAPRMNTMPKPGQGGGGKLLLFALLLLLVTAAAAFWLTRDTQTREQLRREAADAINDATSGTPLAGVGKVLQDPPPPPPPSVTNPRTMPGTLAGQNVQGSVGAPVDSTLAPTQGSGTAGNTGNGQAGNSQNAGDGPALGQNQFQNQANAQSQAAMPPANPDPQAAVPRVTEDSRLRPNLIDDLAAYIVSRYRPGPNGGRLALSVQGINQRYGTKLAAQEQGGRAAILRYAFHPSMLTGLYRLYADRFMSALGEQAQAKRFSAEQTRQLHMALAGRCVVLAGALECVAATPELHRKLQGLESASQQVVDINSQMAVAVFDLDELREKNAAKTQLDAAQMRVDGLSARYRLSLENRAQAQRALVADIRKHGSNALDDDSLLFVASWVDRRLQDNGEALASVGSAAGVLRDLARRCAQTGTN